jgi:hypothetical protein
MLIVSKIMPTINKPDECGERTMALLSLIFNKLNIPLSAKKTIGPVCELEYLGIILDTINMQARLPLEISVGLIYIRTASEQSGNTYHST